MYNMEVIWWTFLEVFFQFYWGPGGGGVMLGPYIKSRGTWGTEMSANADLITVETYVQQGETIWKPVFPAILSPISMYMSNKKAIW